MSSYLPVTVFLQSLLALRHGFLPEEFTPTFTLCSHHDTVKETGAQHGHFTLGGGAPGANSRFQCCATHPTNCTQEPVTFLGGSHHHLHFTDEKGTRAG